LIVAMDRGVFGHRACSCNRRFRRSRLRTNALSNFASRDARKALLHLEQTKAMVSFLAVDSEAGKPTLYSTALKAFQKPYVEARMTRRTISARRWQRSRPNRGQPCWPPDHGATNRKRS